MCVREKKKYQVMWVTFYFRTLGLKIMAYLFLINTVSSTSKEIIFCKFSRFGFLPIDIHL